MNQETKYLVYLTQQGVTVLVSYDDIIDMQRLQPLRVEGSDENYFLTLITFIGGVQEQQAVSEAQWSFWEGRNNG